MNHRQWKTRTAITLPAMIFLILAVGSAEGTHADEPLPMLAVSTNFAGGSGDVESIDQQARVIKLHPTAHSGHGWDCWWFIAVTGIKPGEVIGIDLAGDRFAQADQATFSTDGQTWQHTAPGEKHGSRIVYRQRIDANHASFSWGPPLTGDDAAELIRNCTAKCPGAELRELCRSRSNRPVWELRLAPATDSPKANDLAPSTVVSHRPYGVFITARQHAWESGGSWVCRGLMEWLVSDDPTATKLRSKAEFGIVPVIDVDNVAIGAGGKEEQPQDHNRDWTDHPYHPAVAAVQQEITRLNAAGQFDLFIDLHNPSPTEKSPVFFVSPRSIMSAESAGNLQRFLAGAQNKMTGPIVYRGQTQESGPGYDNRWRQISKNWVTEHTAGHVVSVTLETPWNTPQSTTDGYLATGRQLGMAIAHFFRQPPQHTTAE
jgi:Zinc carboxypeptidase